MSVDLPGRPLALLALAAVYLFSLLTALSSYGYPFPFMGHCYAGRAGEWLVFGDGMISLYLILGILKRQRLSLWLLIGYNLLDVLNAGVNLVLLTPGDYAALADPPISATDLRNYTLAAGVLLMLLNVYAFGNRRHFSNRSLYLF